jgi:hypothetical protein
MKLNRLLIAAFILLASTAKLSAQVSSENLVSIHNLNTTEISGLVSPIKGSLVFNTDSNRLYVFDGSVWIATASVDTTSLSARINQRVKYTDTAAMLVGYTRRTELNDTAAAIRAAIPTLTGYLDQDGGKIYGTTAGTGTAYTLTLNPAITGYVAGQMFNVKFHTANTGAATININGLGAKTLVKDLSTALVANDIPANSQYQILYDGTNFLIKDIGFKGLNTSARLLGTLTDETGSGVAVFGTSPAFTTSVTGGATFAAFNTTTTNLSIGGAATTLNLGGTPTTSITHNLSTNATASGNTKTINLGTGGASGSTTSITIGSSTAGATNNIQVPNLTSGTLSDSLVVADPTTGRLRRIAANRISSGSMMYADTAAMLNPYLRKADTTAMLSPYLRSAQGVKYADTAALLANYTNDARNGLTKSGQIVELGGNLTSATTISNNGNALTIATGGSALNVSGLSGGAATDSLLTINPSTNRINRIAPSVLNRADSTTASNGLTLTGKDVRLGGTLTAATTITNSGANTLRIGSLASGSANDSLVVADASTGELKRIAANRLNTADSTTASNGLTLSGKDVRLGGTLTSATTITNSGANTLRIGSLASGSANDSLVVADASTGELKRIAGSRLNRADSTTASNGLTLTGKDVRLGGTLTAATTITNSGANTLRIGSLASGSANDSLVVADASTGELKRIAANRLSTADSTTASNGLTLTGKDVRLGGTLTSATTITNSGANTLRIGSLASGSANDSLVVADASTGELKRIAGTRLNKADSTTASNGLTLTGKDVRLGGSLSAATTVTTTGANTLAVSGLQSGSTNDSVVVADASSGVLKRISSSRFGGWSLNGNAGTSATTNYIGTSDNVDLVFKINNVQSGKLTLYDLSASFGYNSVAAYKSVAFGSAATTGTGTEASALGQNAQSTGYQSVSVGSDSRATGNGAVAVGQNSNAAYQATAVGSGAAATGNNSTAIGFGATTSQANALILGNSSAQVGIGTSTPGYALDVNAGSNPLKLSGLVSGATTDSVLTINTTGVVRRINFNQFNRPDSTTASNGLTLSGKDVRLGGTLTAATTITNSGANTLRIGSLASGDLNDSLVVADPTTGELMRIAPGRLNKVDSTTASNGLTLSGKDVRLGGALTSATTLSTTAANTLALAGLQNGSASDSLLTMTTGGVLRRTAASAYTSSVVLYADTAAMLNNYLNQANNGLTKSGKTVQLGGNLTGATTITNNTNTLTFATGGTALNISGLTSGAATDSILTLNTTTNRVHRIAASVLNRADSTTASNGLTLTGKDVRLGGTLTAATTITNSGTNTLRIASLASGDLNDSLVVADPTSGELLRIAPGRLNKADSTTASNGLTLTGKDVRLGGNLTTATTVTSSGNALTFATGGTALNITGLTAGAASDSILTITSAGKVNRINAANFTTTASNGLAMTGSDVRLGGNLTASTTITNNSNTLTFATGGSNLNITGLTAGAASDSILTINAGTGKVNRINAANFTTTASNGLTMSGSDARLGGSLTAATTITTTATNTLTLAGLQSSSLNDSVLMATAGGTVRRINSSSLAIEPFNVVGGTTKASSNTQDIYTQGNVSIGKTANAATLDVGGKIKADSSITAPNFVATYQNLGSLSGAFTWNLQSGATAAVTLTGNATVSITNSTAGCYGLIRVTQDGTGSRTLTLGGTGTHKVINGGSGAVTLTQAANSVDILTFFYDGSTYWWTIGNNYK